MSPPNLDEALREALVQAAAQFNTGEFWECHETLEAVWLNAKAPLKTWLQGIIQIAAGCHHIQNCNHKGAEAKLSQGLEKLHATQGILIFNDWMAFDAFIEESEGMLAEVTRLGPDNINRFCPSKFTTLIINF